MTSKQKEVVDAILAGIAEKRPDLAGQEHGVVEDGKNVLFQYGNLPMVRIGKSGGIYLPDSKSFANVTPQKNPTALDAAIFSDRYSSATIEAKRTAKKTEKKGEKETNSGSEVEATS